MAGLVQLSHFKQWRLPVFLTIIGIILKTLSESQNQTILVHDAWAVTPYAHIFGMLAGFLYVIYNYSYSIFWGLNENLILKK